MRLLFALFVVTACTPHNSGESVAHTVYETSCDGPGLTFADCEKEAGARCGGAYVVMNSGQASRTLAYYCKNEPAAKAPEGPGIVIPGN